MPIIPALILKQNTYIPTSTLSIDITKRSSKRTHSIRLRDILKRILKHGAQAQGIRQFAVAAGRIVEEGDGAADGVFAVLEVLVLPDPPDAVYLCVVEVEGLWKEKLA